MSWTPVTGDNVTVRVVEITGPIGPCGVEAEPEAAERGNGWRPGIHVPPSALVPPLYAKPFFDPAALERLRQKADRMLRALMRHRERYLKAWIAQTGILPTDAVLVEREVWDPQTATIVKVVEIITKAEAARRFG